VPLCPLGSSRELTTEHTQDTERIFHNDPSNRPSRIASALSGVDVNRVHHHRRRDFLPAHAGGRLSCPLSPAGRTHYSVARPRGRGSRAPGHAATRIIDERRASHGGHAVHLTLWSL